MSTRGRRKRFTSWFKSRLGLHPAPGKHVCDTGNCRLIAALKAFPDCEIWSKDSPARKGNLALWLEGRADARPFFVPSFLPVRLNA
jgi:hypothetical protein